MHETVRYSGTAECIIGLWVRNSVVVKMALVLEWNRDRMEGVGDAGGHANGLGEKKNKWGGGAYGCETNMGVGVHSSSEKDSKERIRRRVGGGRWGQS